MQASTPEIEDAAQYLLQRATVIQQMAQQRSDLEVEVAREEVSGSSSMGFMHLTFYNAYQNLSNIILRIVPKANRHAKDVLISAHFDSAIGAPGELSAAHSSVSCAGLIQCCRRDATQKPNIWPIFPPKLADCFASDLCHHHHLQHGSAVKHMHDLTRNDEEEQTYPRGSSQQAKA